MPTGRRASTARIRIQLPSTFDCSRRVGGGVRRRHGDVNVHRHVCQQRTSLRRRETMRTHLERIRRRSFTILQGHDVRGLLAPPLLLIDQVVKVGRRTPRDPKQFLWLLSCGKDIRANREHFAPGDARAAREVVRVLMRSVRARTSPSVRGVLVRSASSRGRLRRRALRKHKKKRAHHGGGRNARNARGHLHNQSLSLFLSLFLSFARLKTCVVVEARCEGVRQRARCVLSPLSERSPI